MKIVILGSIERTGQLFDHEVTTAGRRPAPGQAERARLVNTPADYRPANVIVRPRPFRKTKIGCLPNLFLICISTRFRAMKMLCHVRRTSGANVPPLFRDEFAAD